MSKKFDVCVRGGGVVAHALALTLARERLRVALVRNTPPAPGRHDIRAYALNAASRALLEGLRAWPEGTAATPVTAMLIGEREHPASVHFDAASQGEPLAWLVDVPAMGPRLACGCGGPIWEICTKARLGRLTPPVDDTIGELREWGFELLAISPQHAWAIGALPPHHRDPFDRMLVTQAQLEGLTIVTRDPAISQYQVAVLAA